MQSNLPKKAQESARFSVRETLSRNNNFGIILSLTNGNQLSFMMLRKINEYLSGNYKTDIQIYSNQYQIPSITPLTGIFSYAEMMHHSGPIIACDPEAVKKLPIVNEGKYYYYVYDIRQLDFYKEDFFKFLQNLGATLIVRNKEHAKILKDLKMNISNIYVPDCEIEKLMEIVNGK